jgi:hypothetical protein
MMGSEAKVLYEYTVLFDAGFGKCCLFCAPGLEKMK